MFLYCCTHAQDLKIMRLPFPQSIPVQTQSVGIAEVASPVQSSPPSPAFASEIHDVLARLSIPTGLGLGTSPNSTATFSSGRSAKPLAPQRAVLPPTRVYWMSDKNCAECYHCGAQFNFFRRRQCVARIVLPHSYVAAQPLSPVWADLLSIVSLQSIPSG